MTLTLTAIALALTALASWWLSVRILRAVGLMDTREEAPPIGCGSDQHDESVWAGMSKGDKRDVVGELVPPTVEQRIRKGQDVTIVW